MDALLLQKLSTITPEEERILRGQGVDMGEYVSSGENIIDARKMLKNGRLIDIRAHTRFCAFPAHSHNYVEMIYMCAGQTTHRVNDEVRIPLRQGELLLLNQHALHNIEPAGQQDIAVNFIVLPQFFDTAFDMLREENLLADFLLGSLRRSGSEVSYLHFQVADILPVQNLVENMIYRLIYAPAGSLRLNQLSMGLLLMELSNVTERVSFPRRMQGSAPALAALREIEDNYPAASLSATAHRFGMSSAYLSRLIKEATGHTFIELLQQKRLSRARELLLRTRLPVEEICEAVGYENTSYFYRLFRSQYGKSPRQVRIEEEP